MIDNSTNMILYIEPENDRSAEPLIDDLTKQMTAALRKSRPGVMINGMFKDLDSLGSHTCVCGAKSDTTEHMLKDEKTLTNSLCVHYLAWHRFEIPQAELDKVTNLPDDSEEPSAQELQ